MLGDEPLDAPQLDRSEPKVTRQGHRRQPELGRLVSIHVDMCLGLGAILVNRGAAAEAIAPLERGLTVCEPRELQGRLPQLALYLAHAYALAGRVDDGLAALARSADPAKIPAFRMRHPRWLIVHGIVHLLAGRLAEGRRFAEQSLARSRETRQRGDEQALPADR